MSKRIAIVLALLAACSSPPPPATWTLWSIKQTVGSGGVVTKRVTQPIEEGLDRTACELVLAKAAKTLQHRLQVIGASSTGGPEGATYHLGGTMYAEHYACLVQGKKP